jgi:hypothetical protein
MKRLIIGLALAVLLVPILAALSCASEAPEPPITFPGEEGIVPAPQEVPGLTWEQDEKGSGTTVLVTTDERMIVRSGDMSLVVESVNEAMQAITQLAIGYNGYVVSSSVYGEEEDMRGWISIRIPDEKFDQTLADIRGLAIRVEEESTNSQDVTEEYIDLEARLANAEATEQQYLALLDKAEDVEDILRIYDYLSQIRQEIEQLKGRMQYLERTSSMSLISASLRPEFSAQSTVPAGWNALEIFKSAARGLVITGQVLGTIAIWLLIFIPIWGTILGIILWRRHKRKMRG